MCNMLDFMAIDTFLKPAINRLVTNPKDFRLTDSILLGEVRGRPKAIDKSNKNRD